MLRQSGLEEKWEGASSPPKLERDERGEEMPGAQKLGMPQRGERP